MCRVVENLKARLHKEFLLWFELQLSVAYLIAMLYHLCAIWIFINRRRFKMCSNFEAIWWNFLWKLEQNDKPSNRTHIKHKLASSISIFHKQEKFNQYETLFKTNPCKYCHYIVAILQWNRRQFTQAISIAISHSKNRSTDRIKNR